VTTLKNTAKSSASNDAQTAFSLTLTKPFNLIEHNAVTNLKHAAKNTSINAAQTAFSSTSTKPFNLVEGTEESPAQTMTNPTSPSTFCSSEKTRGRATVSKRSENYICLSASKEQAKKKSKLLTINNM